LQLKRSEVGSKMAIAASAPVLPNQNIKQCCKIAQYTDASCVSQNHFEARSPKLQNAHIIFVMSVRPSVIPTLPARLPPTGGFT